MALSITERLKKSKTRLSTENNLSLDDFVIDFKATFGELRFLILSQERFEVDSETQERTDVLKDRRYMLLSSEQETDFIVILPPHVPKKEFDGGDIVELVNPKIEAYAINRYTNGFRVLADDMVLAKDNTMTVSPKIQELPKQDNQSKPNDKK